MKQFPVEPPRDSLDARIVKRLPVEKESYRFNSVKQLAGDLHDSTLLSTLVIVKCDPSSFLVLFELVISNSAAILRYTDFTRLPLTRMKIRGFALTGLSWLSQKTGAASWFYEDLREITKQ